MRKSAEERFWSKVEQTDGCWNWTKGGHPSGYGTFCHQGKNVPAHRYSYQLANGSIPAGLSIDHICHNRGCVNPAHLRAVTHKQNHENRAGADATGRSGIRGVFEYRPGYWVVRVGHHGKVHYGGHFRDVEEARAAAIELRNSLFTHNEADKKAA